MRLSFDIQGLNQLEKQFRNANQQTQDNLKAHIKKTADNIEQKAKALAPEYEGILKSRITQGIADDGLHAIVISKAPHSHLVEFGTKGRTTKIGKSTGKMPAKPFLYPAIQSEKSSYYQGVRDAYKL